MQMASGGTDYVGSRGPMILGHAHPDVIAAVQAVVVDGLSFGAPTEREIDIADLCAELVPSMEMVRLVSSGTEATMSAIALLVVTPAVMSSLNLKVLPRSPDSLLVKAGSGR